MKLLAQELPSPRAIQEAPPRGTNKDPLIAHNLQKGQYAGIIGLAIVLVAAVGFFSRKVEYAIGFAAIFSAILIAIFLFI